MVNVEYQKPKSVRTVTETLKHIRYYTWYLEESKECYPGTKPDRENRYTQQRT